MKQLLRANRTVAQSILITLLCLSHIAHAQKSNGQNTHRTNDGQDEKLQINLYFYDTANHPVVADAALARYNNLYSIAVTSEDVGKPSNVDENVAIQRDNHLLTVERRPLIDFYDTIFLKIYNMKIRNYRFEIIPTHFTAPYLGAYLQDAYLNTETQLNLDSATYVNFSVTNTASAPPYRFRVVFRPLGTLPVNFGAIKAYRKRNGIQVEWNVATETSIQHYRVEKSSDGSKFVKAATVAAHTPDNNIYDWFDSDPFKENNYYRIKAQEYSGSFFYSPVAIVRSRNLQSGITVYPNPVKDRTINVELNNSPGGKYTFLLQGMDGREIFKRIIHHDGGFAVYTINLFQSVSKGAYQLRAISDDGETVHKVIIE